MGWVWRDDGMGSGETGEYDENPNNSTACATRKVVKSQCKTEEVEPGKFIRKCQKTEEILRDCVGQPVEVIKSNKEYTEDDVTDLVTKGSSSKFDDSPFDFPGLQSDIEGIERHVFGGISRFFDAAEQIRNSIFDAFGEIHSDMPSSLPSMRRGVPIEDYPQKEASQKQRETESSNIGLSGLARDV